MRLTAGEEGEKGDRFVKQNVKYLYTPEDIVYIIYCCPRQKEFRVQLQWFTYYFNSILTDGTWTLYSKSCNDVLTLRPPVMKIHVVH